MTPKVSVLMPVYNGDKYLEETLNSVLVQSFTDFEFIIIDDGSKDNTWRILNEYSNKDQRIKLFQNRVNLGLIKTLNKGLKLAKGEYIARQDADDISFASRLEKQVKLLNKNEKTTLVSCNIDAIDANGNKLRQLKRSCDSELVAWYLIFHNRLAGHSQVMFRRKQVLDLGGYSEVNQNSEDYELWSRLVDVGKIEIIPETLLQRRVHNDSLCATRGYAQKNWSLAQSQNNIRKIIGKEISLEEVEQLRCFWKLQKTSTDGFSEVILERLNSRIKEIYQGYVLQKYDNDLLDRHISGSIRKSISNQFLSLATTKTLVDCSLIPKLIFYALSWDLFSTIIFLTSKSMKLSLAVPLKSSGLFTLLKHKFKFYPQ